MALRSNFSLVRWTGHVLINVEDLANGVVAVGPDHTTLAAEATRPS